MPKLANFLRWYFGVEALLFFGIPILALLDIPSLNALHSHNHSPLNLLRLWLPLIVFLGKQWILAAIFGVAWRSIPKKRVSSRVWAILASLSNIPLIYIGRPMWISTAAGVLGLIVFCRRDAFAPAREPAPAPRVPGDGTSRTLEQVLRFASLAEMLGALIFWSHWARTKGLPETDSIVSWLTLVAAMLISAAIHELGHTSMGWTFAMRLRAFIVGPFDWRIRGGRWTFQFKPAGFLAIGGGVALVPSDASFQPVREVCMLAGGALAQLWLGALALLLTLGALGRPWQPAWQLLAYIATTSLIGAVTNLLPMRPEAEYSDGARIFQILSGGPWTDVYRVLSFVGCSLATPFRPKDYDIAAIERAAAFVRYGQRGLMLRLHAYNYFLDCDRIPDALDALGAAEAVYAESASHVPAEWLTIFVFGNAFLKRDAAVARLWWERMEKKKIRTLDCYYWRALSALLWIENRQEEARQAWTKGNVLAQELGSAGNYSFDRDWFARLGKALTAPAAAVDCPSLAATACPR